MTQYFNKKEKTDLRRKLRNSMTKGEVVLWKRLKGKQSGFKFRRQTGIGKYIVDFYCPKLKIVVEIDGLTHCDEKVFENDQRREKYLESLGLFIKRYNSEDVFKKIEQVIEDLYNTCKYIENHPGLRPPLLRKEGATAML